MSKPVASSQQVLYNLGPKSKALLAAIGISTLEQLRQIGSVKAYVMAKRHDPAATLNLLWALEAALTGQHWQEVVREHRTSLLLALDAQKRGA